MKREKEKYLTRDAHKVFDEKPRRTNLGNLSGFATSSLANNYGGSMILDQVKNGLAILVHGQPLSQPLQPFAKRNLSVLLRCNRGIKRDLKRDTERETKRKY